MFTWFGEAREARDVLDALLCVEAVSAESPKSFLDGVREDTRHTCLPEIRNKEAVVEGWTYQRNVRALALQDCPGGSRWLCSMVEHDNVPPGNPTHGRIREKVFVFSMSSPAELIEDALNAVPAQPKTSPGLIKAGLQRLLFAGSKSKPEVPSPATTVLPNASSSARQQHVDRIAKDLAAQLLRTDQQQSGTSKQGSNVELHAQFREASVVIITGHGAGALVAYSVALQLLQLYPDALRGTLRCLTFGMPLMGFSSPEDRDYALRCIAPRSESIPLASSSALLPSLPLPVFQHVLRSRDLVPRCTLCSSQLRLRVGAILGSARRATRETHRQSSLFSPYANADRKSVV